jgi:hypothetical protein
VRAADTGLGVSNRVTRYDQQVCSAQTSTAWMRRHAGQPFSHKRHAGQPYMLDNRVHNPTHTWFGDRVTLNRE